jgi:Fe(3+) dicitrate transport protein
MPLPGLLVEFDVDDAWTLHAGVHRGFSPKAPGQDDDIDAEEFVNYQVGALYLGDLGRLSAVLFFSDYDNLTADDSFAGGGAGSGEQFNGGAVDIFGVEVSASHAIEAGENVRFPLTLSYMYLHSEFKSTFSSDNPQFGDVESGDELPYLPEHQLTVAVGMDVETVHVSLAANYVGWMREEAGTGDPGTYFKVPARTVLDFSSSWRPYAWLRLYFNVQNLLDEEYLVSHRPFGARPGLPRQMIGGLEFSF